MALSTVAQELVAQVEQPDTKLGDIKRLANEIKRNHSLALELWATESYRSRLLATLILDKKLLDQRSQALHR